MTLFECVDQRFHAPTPRSLETPLPGRPSTPQERTSAIARICGLIRDEQHFRVNDTPARVSFNAGIRIRTFERLRAPVVVLVERTSICHTCDDVANLARYFKDKHPWEEYDYYVVEVHGASCVCVTHDDDLVLFDRGQDDGRSESEG